MRTKVITRMATGVCSVCLCYGLVVQALNGDMAAEALSPDALAREQLQAVVETQIQSPSAFQYERTPEQEAIVVSVVLFGRMLCGFVCPLGLMQDLMHEARQALHVEGVPLSERLYAGLRFVKWVLLTLFLGVGLIGGSFCDFCPAITLSPALAGFKTSVYFSGFMMVVVLVSGFFKRRCFCNVCPMGYLLGLPHKLSLARLKKDAVACTECGACYEACPMGIRSVFTLREGKNERAIDVTTADCIFCGECIRRCPEDGALFMSLAGIRIYQASRMKFMKDFAGKSEGGKA